MAAEDIALDNAPAAPTASVRSRRRRLRYVASGLAVALVATVAGGGHLAVNGRAAADHLARAATLFEQVATQVAAGDPAGATVTLAALRRQTRAARLRTSGVGWRTADHVPAVGDDLAAVAVVADVLDDLASNGLPPLIETATTLTSGAMLPRAGRLDLMALSAVAPRFAAADTVLRRSSERIHAVSPRGLDRRVRGRLAELDGHLRRAAAATGVATRAAALLPTMLGGAGPRTYLVVFQNLAEVRATGGLAGAYVVLAAEQGAVRILEQGSAADLGTFERPVLPIDAAQRSLYTDRLATLPGDANFTPHFPTAAALLREMYRLRSGRTVDGVLATDPVALSYLLDATGPVAVPGGPPLTAATVVPTLLSRTYARWPSNDAQDRFFAGAARAVFETLTRLTADPRALLAALGRAAGEHRLLLWSAHPEEQAAIDGTALDGTLPATDGARPTVGVFLNDGTGAKLGYYLTAAADLTVGACRNAGRRELRLRFTLGSTAPRSGLPAAVLGLALAGPYVIRTNVLFFAPTGGAVVAATVGGVPTPIGTGYERGRQVGVLTIDLPPGASAAMEVTLLTRDTRSGPAAVAPRLWTTPTTNPWVIKTGSGPRC